MAELFESYRSVGLFRGNRQKKHIIFNKVLILISLQLYKPLLLIQHNPMANYQFPPLKNEKKFEEFVCDLLNSIENTNSYENTEYQQFGVSGQSQNGIDIFSSKTGTVIQCKLKDLRKQDETIRKQLISDLEADVKRSTNLKFGIKRFYLASTFRDDAVIQEHATTLQNESETPIVIQYWGWDTLSKYAEQHDSIIKKYFPKFLPKPAKQPKKSPVELPDGALGKDLMKKNYVTYLNRRYGDWKQMQFDKEGRGEKFNWASHNKSLMNRYKASGINYIPLTQFEDLVAYLQGRIDKTIFGRYQKSNGKKNYSSFEEFLKDVDT